MQQKGRNHINADKYNGKYRIPGARWTAWDYSSNAAYFVTICTAKRAHDFGEIANGTMVFTALGRAAADCWDEIPAHFPFVLLDAFVVMPNHVHGIVVINKRVETQDFASVIRTDGETQGFASLRGGRGNKFGPQSQNLASIVRGYKIGVTRFARANNIPFEWQARYHDRVIRGAGEHERIAYYILSNPQKWAEDEWNAAQEH